MACRAKFIYLCRSRRGSHFWTELLLNFRECTLSEKISERTCTTIKENHERARHWLWRMKKRWPSQAEFGDLRGYSGFLTEEPIQIACLHARFIYSRLDLNCANNLSPKKRSPNRP